MLRAVNICGSDFNIDDQALAWNLWVLVNCQYCSALQPLLAIVGSSLIKATLELFGYQLRSRQNQERQSAIKEAF